MNIIVQKYGGTSVNSSTLRDKIVENVKRAQKHNIKTVLVVSAMGRKGEAYATDSLQNLISPSYRDTRTMDMLISCGEIISTTVIASHLMDCGIKAISLTGGQGGILTDSTYGSANIIDVDGRYLKELLEEGWLPVVAGFQGQNDKGEITTLGRGGSDTSAVLLGIALQAKCVEIFTDVDGIMTADPKLVPKAKLIEEINYDDVFQLAQYGAKVIHPKAVDLAMQNNIPLKVINTSKYGESKGTLINNHPTNSSGLVAAVAHEYGKIQWCLSTKSTDKEIFKLMASNNISIDMINIFIDRSVFITNDIHKEKLIKILEENNMDYKYIEHCTKITIIGNKIRGVPGVMAKIMSSLEGDISILQTSDSHTTISILVPTDVANKAVNMLHESFNL